MKSGVKLSHGSNFITIPSAAARRTKGVSLLLKRGLFHLLLLPNRYLLGCTLFLTFSKHANNSVFVPRPAAISAPPMSKLSGKTDFKRMRYPVHIILTGTLYSHEKTHNHLKKILNDT